MVALGGMVKRRRLRQPEETGAMNSEIESRQGTEASS
jgi:hypothetical protein